MFKTIIFDVDGTILDTEYVMTRSFQETLQEELQKEVAIEELHYILGIPGKEAIKKFSASEPVINRILATWDKKILAYSHYATIFPGIEAILATLQQANVSLGIVTSKTTREMENEFDHFQLNQFFDVIVTASDTRLHKPHPDPLLKAVELLAADKETTLYIGDSLYDLQCAKASGVQFALAKWGALDLTQFAAADYILESPEEIFPLTHE